MVSGNESLESRLGIVLSVLERALRRLGEDFELRRRGKEGNRPRLDRGGEGGGST